jgi:putative tryptophan/tyrosine transport system substrate-binding protein
MIGSGLLPCKLTSAPISLVENPCCNRIALEKAMRRRDFIEVIAGSIAALPLAARAQQLPVVGFPHAGSADGYAKEVGGFKQGLREGGYLEGQTVVIDYHWADFHYERLADLAVDLVHKRVAVIVAAPIPAALAAKDAT